MAREQTNSQFNTSHTLVETPPMLVRAQLLASFKNKTLDGDDEYCF